MTKRTDFSGSYSTLFFSESTPILVVTWLGLLTILLALANYVDRTGQSLIYAEQVTASAR